MKKVYLIFIFSFLFVFIPLKNLGGVLTFKQAHNAFLNKQYKNAILLYTDFLKQFGSTVSENIIKANIELSDAYFNLGMQYFRNGKYEFAQQLFYSANSPEGDKMVSKCICKIAEKYFNMGDLNKSLELYKSVDTQEGKEGANEVLYSMAKKEFAKRHFAKAGSLYCESGTDGSIDGLTKSLYIISKRKGYGLKHKEIKKWIDNIGLQGVLSMGFNKFLYKVKREKEARALWKKGEQLFYQNRFVEARRYYRRIINNYNDSELEFILQVQSKIEKCTEQISKKRLLKKLETSSYLTFLSKWKEPHFTMEEIILIEGYLNEAPLGIRISIDEHLGLPKKYGFLNSYGKLYAILKLLDNIAGQNQWARAAILNKNLYIPISVAEKLAALSSNDMK